ncbi:MAG: aldehyde dehydrogenase family protein [Rickettsiales bacterium]|nr:aldehyde dehydrogenase family protein [Rickettsiales bacterium]
MKINIKNLLSKLSVEIGSFTGEDIIVKSPINSEIIAKIKADDKKSVEVKIKKSQNAFNILRDIPAPKRGELIRLYAEELRKVKEDLANLVTIECGKIIEEARGEVQEMIDICDYATGLSRTISGLTLQSERSLHSMQENWLPLGIVGVISAFNFPVAVWCWNFAIAIICGDSVIWKPSEKTPLTALASQAIFYKALQRFTKEQNIKIPQEISQIILGDYKIGEQLVNDKRIALISATGSTRMGRIVGENVAKRFGKSLLELGGNNAVIVTTSANMEIVLPSIIFGVVGTAGQRCTSTRRIIAHHSLIDDLQKKLIKSFAGLKNKIGNPLDDKNLVGPIIDENAYKNMQKTILEAKKQGGKITGGDRVIIKNCEGGFYINPAIIRVDKHLEIMHHETFAPIVYIMPYKTLEEAIELNNCVPQGLSSAIFTNDLGEAEIFKKYSDCGIANVNIGTSGAEIGGAFGGEKETGGGRESGSDSWKAYMRRQTSTTYYGKTSPELAQGVKFE